MGSGAKKGKGKKGKSTPATAMGGDQKLNHSLDMIDAFSKLKVPTLWPSLRATFLLCQPFSLPFLRLCCLL